MPIRAAKMLFDANLTAAEKLILDAMQLHRDGHLEESQQFDIVEVGFLKVVIAWEELISTCFLNYMIGEFDLTGAAAVRYVNPRDLEHAEAMVLEGKSYVEWGSTEFVRRIANSFFEDGWLLIDALNSSTIANVKLIRNRIAHRSNTTENRFRDVVRAMHGTVPVPGWSPGQFLVQRKSSRSPRYYRELIRGIQVCAAKLVND